MSASIYKHLNEEEIERLTLEISGVKKVEPNIKEDIIEEFHNIALAQDYISQGGIGYAKTVLEKALGTEHAQAIINRLHIFSTSETIRFCQTCRAMPNCLTLSKMNIRKR